MSEEIVPPAMTELRRIETSVIIVGGGPVGLALAATLGTAGVPCVLLERCAELSAIPKGQNLTARSLEHFYYWGCADELRAARLLPPGLTAASRRGSSPGTASRPRPPARRRPARSSRRPGPAKIFPMTPARTNPGRAARTAAANR